MEITSKTLGDLDIDSLMNIFKDVSFDDLISLSTMNKQISNAVWEDMRLRFSRKKVVFDGIMIRSKYGKRVEETNDEIKIEWDEGTILALEQFGKSIRKIKIWNFTPDNRAMVEKALKLINEHCTDSLIELDLGDFKINFFNYITKPFRNVESLRLYGDVRSVENNDFCFKELFPSLRRLTIDIPFKASNKKRLFVNLPNLEYVDLDAYINDAVARGIIEKNPQIKKAVLQYASPDLLYFACTAITNLEHLELIDFQQKDGQFYEYHFESVKIFKLMSYHNYNWPNQLIFSNQLEEFYVDVSFKDIDTVQYLQFITRYNSIKRLTISSSWYGISDDSITQIINAKLNLDELSLHYGRDVYDEKIVSLIKSNKELKKFHLRFINEPEKVENFAKMLCKQFESPWTIKTSGRDVFMTRNAPKEDNLIKNFELNN